jgi:hypothetical protein
VGLTPVQDVASAAIADAYVDANDDEDNDEDMLMVVMLLKADKIWVLSVN